MKLDSADLEAITSQYWTQLVDLYDELSWNSFLSTSMSAALHNFGRLSTQVADIEYQIFIMVHITSARKPLT